MNITHPFWLIIRANYTDREYDVLALQAEAMDRPRLDDPSTWPENSPSRTCPAHGAWCDEPTNPHCACDACEGCEYGCEYDDNDNHSRKAD